MTKLRIQHTQPSTMSGRKNHRTTKTCHRACLFAIADFADTKKLNLLGQENGMTELKNYLKPLTDKNAQLVIE